MKPPGRITKINHGKRNAKKRMTAATPSETIPIKSFKAAPIGETDDRLTATRSLV